MAFAFSPTVINGKRLTCDDEEDRPVQTVENNAFLALGAAAAAKRLKAATENLPVTEGPKPFSVPAAPPEAKEPVAPPETKKPVAPPVDTPPPVELTLVSEAEPEAPEVEGAIDVTLVADIADPEGVELTLVAEPVSTKAVVKKVKVKKAQK